MVRNEAVEGRLSFSEQNDEGEVSEPVSKVLRWVIDWAKRQACPKHGYVFIRIQIINRYDMAKQGSLIG